MSTVKCTINVSTRHDFFIIFPIKIYPRNDLGKSELESICPYHAANHSVFGQVPGSSSTVHVWQLWRTPLDLWAVTEEEGHCWNAKSLVSYPVAILNELQGTYKLDVIPLLNITLSDAPLQTVNNILRDLLTCSSSLYCVVSLTEHFSIDNMTPLPGTIPFKHYTTFVCFNNCLFCLWRSELHDPISQVLWFIVWDTLLF
jgi:hypothetical protein